MAFQPSEEYWGRKLGRLRDCVQELEAKIPTLTDQRQIDAHQSYLESVKRCLKMDEGRYRVWRNRRQNEERKSVYG